MTDAALTLRAPSLAGPPLPDHAELLLEEFLRTRAIKQVTEQMYRYSLQSWTRRVTAKLADASPEDVATWYARMSGGGMSPATILTYAFKLRALYAWTLRSQGLKKRAARAQAGDLFEEVPLADLKRKVDRENELRDKLVTPEEYETLMAASDHPRIRALLATLYEAAARPGEILGLRIRDLDFREKYAQIRVSGKTGERTIPLVRAIPYLRAWLQVHPTGDDVNAPLFAHIYRSQVVAVTVDALQTNFRRLRKRVGLKRRIHPYMFRHTRLTELADNDLGEYKMKVLAGWTPDSLMAARYIHLSGRSSIAPILEMEGIEAPDETQPRPSPIKLRTCPRCSAVNEGDALYCMRCGCALSQDVALADRERDEEEDVALVGLLDDPRVKKVVLEALKEVIAQGGLQASGGSSTG